MGNTKDLSQDDMNTLLALAVIEEVSKLKTKLYILYGVVIIMGGLMLWN